MSISERCEAEKITSLVQHHVPKGKLSQQHEAELTFTLPFESLDTFSGQIRCDPPDVTAGQGHRGNTHLQPPLIPLSSVGLFSALDGQPSLGVVNYGVSMTTLEDVFLRLEAEAEVDQAGVLSCRGSVTYRKCQNHLIT